MFKNPPHSHPPSLGTGKKRIIKFFIKAEFEDNFVRKKYFEGNKENVLPQKSIIYLENEPSGFSSSIPPQKNDHHQKLSFYKEHLTCFGTFLIKEYLLDK